MQTLLIALGAAVAFVVAYHTYGRWLGSKIFRLTADAVCPSYRLRDDVDYVPTHKGVVFGHHFTSIAGTGPIVGPAIAVMWGWLPALLWVVLGSIFIGAVHDLGSLVVSLRNNGQTVGDIAGRVLNKRVRLLFLFVLFLALTIVLAIFGLVIAAVFRMYPAAIFPCLVQIPLAIAIGMWLHRRGANLLIPSLIALAVMYLTVIFGDQNMEIGIPFFETSLHAFNTRLAGWPTMVWVGLLLIYSYAASVLPVWILLQPRDYINSLQLISALGLIVVGLTVAAFAGGAPPVEGAERVPLEIVAPVVNWSPADAPLMFPFLFITIACGAISGFHCLVSSGTSSKQLKCEPDACFVGFGSMLTEGFLAVLVILACVAGLGLGVEGVGNAPGFDAAQAIAERDNLRVVAADGSDVAFIGEAAYTLRYSSWAAAGGLAKTVSAFVDGSANFLAAMSIPRGVSVALMGVLVASFAGTTLDSACRLQRYVIQELAATFMPKTTGEGQQEGAAKDVSVSPLNPIGWLHNKHGATLFAVTLAAIIAALPRPGENWSWAAAGQGGLILWPMFGATNQLLGGLAFMVVAFWLRRRRVPIWFMILPMIFMLIMPAWAMILQLFHGMGAEPAWLFAPNKNWVLIFIAMATLVLEAWMIIEAVLLWPRVHGVLETAMEPAEAPSATFNVQSAG